MASATSMWLVAQIAAAKGSIRHHQHRTALYLIAGNLIAAATGLLFWLLLARVSGLPAAEIGIGYALVGMGATVGVIAKGGLDTALLGSVPITSRQGAARLLRLGMLVGAVAALVLTAALGLGATWAGVFPLIGPLGWTLVGVIAVLLVVTWLQDAYYLAEGQARFAVQRNLVLSVVRILLPLPLIALAWVEPVAMTWLLAVAASALTAAFVARRLPARAGRIVTRGEFLRRSLRNEASSAFEFLPGLLLAPIVLLVDGPTSAGHFAIVWAAASLLFVLSAAIGRSALAAMVQGGPAGVAAAVRKGAWQHVVIILPAATVGLVLAPVILGIFGSEYASAGAFTFAILCASILVVAPCYLYLTVLRAADRTGPLMAFPAFMLGAVVLLAPLLGAQYGLPGVGMAWLLANLPFGLFAAWKLRKLVGAAAPTQATRVVLHTGPGERTDAHEALP